MKLPSFKLPCGSKNFYPEIIDYYTRKGHAVVFHTISEKNFKAYLIYPKKKDVDIVGEGTLAEMIYLYESLELEEHTVSDPSGGFKFKLAANEEELGVQIKKFVENES